MRIPGWYWWVAALGTYTLAALAIVFPVHFLGAQMSQDLAAGTDDSFDALMDIVFGPFFALFFLAGSIYPGYYAAESLAHYRLRKRAINGDPEAMPLAYPPFPPVAAGDLPDLSAAPITLQWRARRDMPLFITGLLVWSLAQQPDKLAYIEANLLQFIGISLVVVAMIVVYIMLARIHRFQAKHSFGVIATSEGLDSIDESGRHAFIPWAEARLFEVDMPSRFGPHVSATLQRRGYRSVGPPHPLRLVHPRWHLRPGNGAARTRSGAYHHRAHRLAAPHAPETPHGSAQRDSGRHATRAIASLAPHSLAACLA